MGSRLHIYLIYEDGRDMEGLLRELIKEPVLNQSGPPEIDWYDKKGEWPPITLEDIPKIIEEARKHLEDIDDQRYSIALSTAPVIPVYLEPGFPHKGTYWYLKAGLASEVSDNELFISSAVNVTEPRYYDGYFPKTVELIEALVKETKPVFAFVQHSTGSLGFHYYADPYGFACPVVEQWLNFKIAYGQNRITDALNYPVRLKDIELAKQHLSRDELTEIIKSNCLEAVPLNDSLGVWVTKFSEEERMADAFQVQAPAYFICAELRKRGVELASGVIEMNGE